MVNPTDVSLLSFRTQVRQRADMQQTKFVTDSELNGYINASIFELYDILVSMYADWYTGEYYYPITNGQGYVPVQEDVYKVRGVDMNTNGNWVTLRAFNFEDRNMYNNAWPYVRYFAPGVRYRVFGNKILLTPKDNSDGNYRIYYIPKFTPLVGDSDVFDAISGWEEYVIVDAAIKCLQKEESDTSVLQYQKQALLARIEALAADRDAGEPQVITDLSSTGFDNEGGWNW